MHYMTRFIRAWKFPSASAVCVLPIPLLLCESIPCFHCQLSNTRTATSCLVLFLSLSPFTSPAYLPTLSMSLTFWKGRLRSSINSAARSCRPVLLCGQNSDPHCTLPPKILQPKHSTDHRAAGLKRDSNYRHIPPPSSLPAKKKKWSCPPNSDDNKRMQMCTLADVSLHTLL